MFARTIVDSVEYQGYTIQIYIVDEPLNPLKDVIPFGTYVCFHKEYDIGTVHNFRTVNEFLAFLEKVDPPVVLPLYIYDHGDIAIKGIPFPDPSDSYQVGYCYITEEAIKDAFSVSKITGDCIEDALDLLFAELSEYAHYLSGDVYGYHLKDPEGTEIIQDNGSYYGDNYKKSGLLDSAMIHIEEFLNNDDQKKAEKLLAHQRKLKAQIKHGAPLSVRKNHTD